MRLITTIFTLGLGMWLCACSATTIAPAEQIQQNTKPQLQSVAKGRDVVKKQLITEYRCANSKTVRVQKSSNKKNKTVTLTFNQVSHKLSPTLSNQGKKYSNIRWIWLEGFDGKAVLSNNRQKVLAENCVKK
ncbi:hypothetical protein A1D29_00245 [Pasteurellaceae bacterium Orientalotternb1]|nr:hypothetical protein A1D29_00245 [Pasteurellaceae bacterium Orientalotternb1]